MSESTLCALGISKSRSVSLESELELELELESILLDATLGIGPRKSGVSGAFLHNLDTFLGLLASVTHLAKINYEITM